jgi:hypothetical protein
MSVDNLRWNGRPYDSPIRRKSSAASSQHNSRCVVARLQSRLDLSRPSSTASLCRCLNPIRSAASRVRASIEAVLDYAKARNYRDGDNPARWKGHLETLLAEAAGYPRPGPHGSYALRRAASVHDRAAGSG